MLFIGRILWGIGVGFGRLQSPDILLAALQCQSLTEAFQQAHYRAGDHCAFIYTAEMAPPRWRGRLNTLVQCGTITGIVIASAINIGTNRIIW